MSTDNTVPKVELEQPKIPTKEELMAYLQEQLEVKELQVKVQECNTILNELLLREKEAIYKMAELSTRSKLSPENLIDHIVTEQDLENNPEMKKSGIKAGDHIKIPKGEAL